MTENSESKVANLLASIDNLPECDFGAKIAVLTEIIDELQRQIEGLAFYVFFELPEVFELQEKMLTVEEVES